MKNHILLFSFVVFISACEKDMDYRDQYTGNYNFTVYYHYYDQGSWSGNSETFDTINYDGDIRRYVPEAAGSDHYLSDADQTEDEDTKISVVFANEIWVNSVVNSSGKLIKKKEPFTTWPYTEEYYHEGEFITDDSVWIDFHWGYTYGGVNYNYDYTILGAKQ